MSENVIPTGIAAHLIESKVNWERSIDAAAVLTTAVGALIAEADRAGVVDSEAVLELVRGACDDRDSPMAVEVMSILERQTRAFLRR